ncbi:MAG TPA: FlgD immunoglobulin-like domain containing protein, partial [bacterium]
EDKGLTWTEIIGINYLSAAQAAYTWGLAAFNIDETIWCAATTADGDTAFVFRSYDAGLTWDSFRVPTDVNVVYPRAIAFTDLNNGMMANEDGVVAKSVDGGATWTVTNKPDTSAACWVNGLVAIPNSNIIVAMDDIGAFYTTDLGATWGKFDLPAEAVGENFIGGVFLNKDWGYFFILSGKYLRFEHQETEVALRPGENMPINFNLSQNYPNPFNPTTTITFSVPQIERVSLKVYNLMGAEIKTLVDGVISVGSHSVIWDGTDNFGQKVTSGLYLYTLQIGNQQIAKRMVLVK